MRIGVLGNGQLGQMLQQSVADLADVDIALYDLRAHEEDKLIRFLDAADVVTFETENIPAALVTFLDNVKEKTFPSVDVLRTFQHRLQEKQALRAAGIATADFCAVRSRADIDEAVSQLGLPILLKTTTEGYDGKGQFLLKREEDSDAAWETLGDHELIAEAFVPFIREASVIASRGRDGDVTIWPMTENVHHQGILRYSIYPMKGLSEAKKVLAENYVRQLTESFDYVGTITLELFETEDGLVANEVAPRVHNSGHWSIEGAKASQFRNHILALAGKPLEPAEALYPAVAMLNVIGDEEPAVVADDRENVYRHSYHKEARPARKLGHITVVANSPAERDETIRQLSAVIPEAVRLTGR